MTDQMPDTRRERTADLPAAGEISEQGGDCALLARLAALAGAEEEANHLPTWYRPVVAIPTSNFTSQFGRWHAEGVESAIGRALGDVSADAYYFPCRPMKRQENPFLAVWQVIRRADAVVIPGGLNEMLPGWFAQSPVPQKGTAEWEAWWEDWWRWHLTQLALLLCVPLLCIDQGAGYLNRVLGGTLYEDIRLDARSYGQHLRGNFDADNWVFTALEILAPESRIATCANGEPHIWGACMHRQAIKDAAPSLSISARAMDKCPEVLERTDAFFGMGLYTHPEQRDVYETQAYARNLFAMLCEAALVFTASQASRHSGWLDALRETIWLYLAGVESPRLMLTPEEALRFQPGELDEAHGAPAQSTDAIHPL